MINPKSIQEVFETAKVEDVVQDFVNLRKRGANLIGLCPFHNEKTPSFTVSPTKNLYKCFGCGKGGNAVQFMIDHEQMSYIESIRYLAQKYNIELEETETTEAYKEEQRIIDSLFIINEFASKTFEDQLFNHQEGKSVGLSYFKERGFNERIIKKFRLGYSLKNNASFLNLAKVKGYKIGILQKIGLISQRENDFFRSRVMFPIRNLSGKVIGFGGRTLSTHKKSPKYLNSPESEIYNKRKSLYGIFEAKSSIRKEDECILVEGYTDVLSLHQSGIENVVASSGTSLTEDQIRLIKRFTDNIKILYDGDTAGIKAAMRGMNLILEQGLNVKLILLPEGEDPDSFLSQKGMSEFKSYLKEESKDFIIFKTDLLKKESANDPILRSKMLADIILTISKIPDTLKRAIYIQECARILAIEEHILVKEVNKQIKKALGKRKSTYKSDFPEELDYLPNETTDEQESPQPSIKLNLDDFQEKDIARVIVQHGEKEYFVNDHTKSSVVEFVYTNLKTHLPKFKIKKYSELISGAYNYYITNHELPESYFITHENQDIRDVAISFLTSPYEFAKWQEKGAGLMTQKSPEQNQIKDAFQSVLRYLLKQLKLQIKTVKDEVKELEANNGDINEISLRIKIVKKLQEEKAMLSKEIDTNFTHMI